MSRCRQPRGMSAATVASLDNQGGPSSYCSHGHAIATPAVSLFAALLAKAARFHPVCA